MWWSHGDWSWGAWLVMSASMIAIWTLVIWGIVTVARGSNTSTGERDGDPERVLAERFAAGDIDADEYRQRLETLRGAGHGPRVEGRQ
jgi:putative membrane protein